MIVVDVTQARNDLFNMVNAVQDGEKYIITSRTNNAVLIGEEEYDGLMETLHVLSDPDMASDLDEARSASLSDMEVWTCRDTERCR